MHTRFAGDEGNRAMTVNTEQMVDHQARTCDGIRPERAMPGEPQRDRLSDADGGSGARHEGCQVVRSWCAPTSGIVMPQVHTEVMSSAVVMLHIL